jgi:hypothetical protein
MYQIILYNNGKRVKVIKNYNLYTNAIKKYRSILKDNKVYFPKKTLWDGSETDYELVLIAPVENKTKEFFRNEFGAMVRVKPKGDFSIKQISQYKIEEVFRDKIKNKKIVFKDVIKTLIKKHELTPVIYVLNNKIYVEYFDDDEVDLYVLKNCDDAYRLCETIRSFASANNLVNFIYFHEPSLENKTRIYDLLSERYKITREYMYRLGTR